MAYENPWPIKIQACENPWLIKVHAFLKFMVYETMVLIAMAYENSLPTKIHGLLKCVFRWKCMAYKNSWLIKIHGI